MTDVTGGSQLEPLTEAEISKPGSFCSTISYLHSSTINMYTFPSMIVVSKKREKRSFLKILPSPTISTGYAIVGPIVKQLLCCSAQLSTGMTLTITIWCKAHHYHWCKQARKGHHYPPQVQDWQGVHWCTAGAGTVDIPRRRVLPPTCCVIPLPT